jgi:hypothetical protein
MRVKFGSLITEGAGSLGGHTIQKSNYGSQLRSKPVNKKNPTFSQSLIRSYYSIIHGGWRALSNAERTLWSKSAPHPLSGSQFWFQVQFTRLHEGLPFLVNPANRLNTYLGPELIDQDLWNAPGLAWWSEIDEGWSGDGTSLFHNGSYSRVRKNLFWDIGSIYRVRLNCKFSSGYIFAPYDGTGSAFAIYSSNFYTFFYSPDDRTRMYIAADGSSISISFLSIKQVYNYNG